MTVKCHISIFLNKTDNSYVKFTSGDTTRREINADCSKDGGSQTESVLPAQVNRDGEETATRVITNKKRLTLRSSILEPVEQSKTIDSNTWNEHPQALGSKEKMYHIFRFERT